MKGLLIVLLFTGQTTLMPFHYTPKDWDGHKGIDDYEIVMSCTERADELYLKLAEHTFEDPRGQGWYLKNGKGTLQGYIC